MTDQTPPDIGGNLAWLEGKDPAGIDEVFAVLKDQFATQRLPGELSYRLIVTACVAARRRLGVDPDQETTGPGAGLALDADTGQLTLSLGGGLLKGDGPISVDAAAPLRATADGLFFGFDPACAVDADASGLLLKAIAPLMTTEAGLAVTTGKGTTTTDSGLTLALRDGGHLVFESGAVRVRAEVYQRATTYSDLIRGEVESFSDGECDRLYKLLKGAAQANHPEAAA